MRAAFLAIGLAACTDPTVGTQLRMNFGDGAGFYDAPFPSDHRLAGDGTVDVSGFPTDDNEFTEGLLALADGVLPGFATSGAVFFKVGGEVDVTALPDVFTSVAEGAPVVLTGVTGPDRGVRLPVDVHFQADGSAYADDRLLSVLPLQGRPMFGGELYAAAILRDLGDGDGEPLAHSPVLRDLRRGRDVGVSAEVEARYGDAFEALEELGVDPVDIAGLAVFTTLDPRAGMRALTEAIHARPLPQPLEPWELTEVFDGFCVYHSTVDMPVFQAGEPPFLEEGGAIEFDADGVPIHQVDETANVWVTVPRTPMPAGGYPTVAFVRTGGGGERPLVDRGVRDATGAYLEDGSGPAREFALAGVAGISVDGPHGGLRNVSNSDEQFLMFNVGNIGATRDNVRQSAAELTLLPDLLDTLEVPAGDCPGSAAAPAVFDTDALGLMGHSTGAWIAPLVLAEQPRFRAAILSGAGSSWIANILWKQSPLDVRPLAETILDYNGDLHAHEPVLTLLQWAGEAADAQVYGRDIVHGEPARNVLMLQGIVDTYIMPPIANATSLSMGLDQAGSALDAEHPDLAALRPVSELLPLVGRGPIGLPARDNVGGGVTAVVVQHPEDGVEDGHEVVFQTEPPKYQYRCFLESWLADGTPEVPESGVIADPCP